jgi:hypothetical protein
MPQHRHQRSTEASEKTLQVAGSKRIRTQTPEGSDEMAEERLRSVERLFEKLHDDMIYTWRRKSTASSRSTTTTSLSYIRKAKPHNTRKVTCWLIKLPSPVQILAEVSQ